MTRRSLIRRYLTSLPDDCPCGPGMKAPPLLGGPDGKEVDPCRACKPWSAETRQRHERLRDDEEGRALPGSWLGVVGQAACFYARGVWGLVSGRRAGKGRGE